jgi:RNA polymerase sigma-70 factor (ECF subfamily)
MQWQNRTHFFAVSSQLMRRLLVGHARRQNLKRGGGVSHVSLDDAVGWADSTASISSRSMTR